MAQINWNSFRLTPSLQLKRGTNESGKVLYLICLFPLLCRRSVSSTWRRPSRESAVTTPHSLTSLSLFTSRTSGSASTPSKGWSTTRKPPQVGPEIWRPSSEVHFKQLASMKACQWSPSNLFFTPGVWFKSTSNFLRKPARFVLGPVSGGLPSPNYFYCTASTQTPASLQPNQQHYGTVALCNTRQ